MRRLIDLVVLLTVGLPISVPAQDKAAEELVRQYVHARSQTMQEKASVTDIERTLSFCADGFVYEHPSMGARIEGKDRVRSGMSGYLGETKDAAYTLRILASNPHVVVARVDQRFLARPEKGNWAPATRSNITVFEIKGGKIARILDY